MPTALQKTRRIAWVALLVGGALQGWVFRHFVSPDGVAYLDLSDAVVRGRLSELVNAYWSPLYPVAIGLVRLVLSPTPFSQPYWEFALVHVVNLAGLVLALAAFDALLHALDESGQRWGQSALSTVPGRAVGYGLFGVAALVMISVGGTVPDLFLAAALFAAFACLLRLAADGSSRPTAIKLGVVLALGALTKSIMFPLAVVMLATLAFTARRVGGVGASLRAGGVFLALTLPWVIAVSLATGRPSTGETGSLNFAWYVNHQQPPNTGVMPALSAPRDTLPLNGLAVMSDARGTNPLWYDPARWHRDVRPRFDLGQMVARAESNLAYFLALLAPLLFVALAIGAAMQWRDLRVTIARSSVVLVPSLAAIGAYAMVYATARYVAPFVVAACVTLIVASPPAPMLRRDRLILAASLALLVIDALSPLRGRVFVTYAVALAALSWAAWPGMVGRRRLVYAVGTWLGLLLLVIQLPSFIVRGATLVVGVIMWVRLSRAELPDTAESIPARRVLAFGGVAAFMIVTAITGWHAVARWGGDRPVGAGPHPEWSAAQQLVERGIPAGSKIAVMGNPESAGWARLARFQIVAVIPESRIEAFMKLDAADRDRIIATFVRAGAVQLVRTSAP